MIPATDVVVGDALVLEAGDIVPADARLHLAHALRINEAPLTGERAPVQKRVAPAAADAHLAERTDCVFMGTSVSAGTGGAEVTATGMGAELGKRMASRHVLIRTFPSVETLGWPRSSAPTRPGP